MDRKTRALALGELARRRALLFLSILALLTIHPLAAQDERAPNPVATFSILGYDAQTGEVGGAVQSRVFSVGNGVLWAEAEVGAVATQAIVDVSYGPQALQLLKKGQKPADIVKTIWEGDPDPGLRNNPWPKAGRQFAVMDAKGNYAVFTGPKATAWAGNKGGKFSRERLSSPTWWTRSNKPPGLFPCG